MSDTPGERDPTDDSEASDGELFEDESETDSGARSELKKTKARLEAEADRAVSEFDQGVVDLLAWILDTETRARIYVYLRQHPQSTSDEIADGTGLYPSTVREALAELHDEETVGREKRENAGAGNNPYEYEAIAPSNLVRGVVGQVQRELNTVFNLEDRLGGAEGETGGPVTITVGGDDDDDGVGETDVAADSGVDKGIEIDVEEADSAGESADEPADDNTGDDTHDDTDERTDV